MVLFNKRKNPPVRKKSHVPSSLVGSHAPSIVCKRCSAHHLLDAWDGLLRVCSVCHHHHRLSAMHRIRLLTDAKTFVPYTMGITTSNPLVFVDTKSYDERLEKAQEKTALVDAIQAGKATLGGLPFHLAVFEFDFMGGSMGMVVGEMIARVFDHAFEDHVPAVIVSASGGARMQEGIFSLMQMAKTIAALNRLHERGIPYISILTDPTTGGVAASFATLGDVILAEPGALIGFAGPRIIEQALNQKLPPGFQQSEFLLKHGFVDRVVPRAQLTSELRTWMWQLGRNTCRFMADA